MTANHNKMLIIYSKKLRATILSESLCEIYNKLPAHTIELKNGSDTSYAVLYHRLLLLQRSGVIRRSKADNTLWVKQRKKVIPVSEL